MTSPDSWSTPPELVEALAAEFGPFDLDPAADPENAKAPKFYTADDDGLSLPWFGRCWCNPPYDRHLGRWVTKARGEVGANRADLVVLLIPSRTDTAWWRELTGAASLVRFLPSRIKFSGKDRAPWGCAVVVLGSLPHEVTFNPYGSTLWAGCHGCAWQVFIRPEPGGLALSGLGWLAELHQRQPEDPAPSSSPSSPLVLRKEARC